MAAKLKNGLEAVYLLGEFGVYNFSDITKPAGAGDVPLANYKMIGALAVKRGELDRKGLADFTTSHGLTGWAPTQGHIPSGVPYIGFACEDIKEGKEAMEILRRFVEAAYSYGYGK